MNLGEDPLEIGDVPFVQRVEEAGSYGANVGGSGATERMTACRGNRGERAAGVVLARFARNPTLLFHAGRLVSEAAGSEGYALGEVAHAQAAVRRFREQHQDVIVEERHAGGRFEVFVDASVNAQAAFNEGTPRGKLFGGQSIHT